MTLGQLTHSGRTITAWTVIRVLAVVAAVLIAVLALQAALGMPLTGPPYDIVPDPAGPLPF